MKSKKPSLYDAQEKQIQLQSASFVDFLTRKGVLEDHNIDNERVRKAKKDTAQRAYHNTEVLLSQYRLIIWVLECIPGELSDELEVPVHDIDALAEKIDIQTSLENARIESRVNAMMKTRYLVDRIHEALAVIRKKPGNGEDLYSVLYTTYLDPVERKHEEILKERKVLIADVYMKTHEEIEVIESFFEGAPADATPLWYLGESIKLLGTADFAVFAPGWQDYRGCRIEHDAAVAYGIPIVEV